jgi:hypothetical protein
MLLPSLAVVLLAVAPGHASLLASETPPTRPSARLLSQAEGSSRPLPPPLPSEEPAPEAREERLRQLTLEVAALDQRIQAIDPRWSRTAALLVVGGSVLMGVGLVLLVSYALDGFAGDVEGSRDLLIAALLVEIVGGGVIGGGFLLGTSAKTEAEAEKRRLTRERDRLQAERQALEARRAALEPSRTRLPRLPVLPVLALRF